MGKIVPDSTMLKAINESDYDVLFQNKINKGGQVFVPPKIISARKGSLVTEFKNPLTYDLLAAKKPPSLNKYGYSDIT